MGRQRFRRMLVITEVALSLMLVFGAGLLVRSLIRLQQQDPGFRPDHLLIAHIYIPPPRYPDSEAISRFCDAFAGRVQRIPGVVGASSAKGYPPVIGWQQMFTLPGRPVLRIADVPRTRFAAAH